MFVGEGALGVEGARLSMAIAMDRVEARRREIKEEDWSLYRAKDDGIREGYAEQPSREV